MSNGQLNYALTLDSGQFMSASATANNAVTTLSQNTKLFGATARIAGDVAQVTGNTGLATLATTASMAGMELKALREIAAGAGLSLGAVGLIAVGVAGAAGIVTSAVEAMNAATAEDASADAYNEQAMVLRNKLYPELEKAYKLKKITRDEFNTAVGTLNMVKYSETPDAKLKGMRSVQGLLEGVNQKQLKAEAQLAMDELVDGLKIGLLDGAEKRKAELRRDIRKQQDDLIVQADKLGVSARPGLKVLDQVLAKSLAQVDAEEAKKETSSAYKPKLTSLEAIGFTFERGSTQGGDLRRVAKGVDRTNQILTQTNRLLAGQTSGDGNYSNQ
jgi:hypothetical protein